MWFSYILVKIEDILGEEILKKTIEGILAKYLIEDILVKMSVHQALEYLDNLEGSSDWYSRDESSEDDFVSRTKLCFGFSKR